MIDKAMRSLEFMRAPPCAEINQRAQHQHVEGEVEQRRMPDEAIEAEALQQQAQAVQQEIGEQHQTEQGRDEDPVDGELPVHEPPLKAKKADLSMTHGWLHHAARRAWADARRFREAERLERYGRWRLQPAQHEWRLLRYMRRCTREATDHCRRSRRSPACIIEIA